MEINNLNDFKAFIEYNAIKKRKILILFDDMITDMLSKKKLNPMLTLIWMWWWEGNFTPLSIFP